MKTKYCSLIIGAMFLLKMGLAQNISPRVLIPLKTNIQLKGKNSVVVHVLPGERLIEKYIDYKEEELFCVDSSGTKTKLYSGKPVNYFSHSRDGNRICFISGNHGEFIIENIISKINIRYRRVDSVYLKSFADISNDGNEIVFHKSRRRRREGETINNNQIIVKNINSNVEHVIGYGAWPKWNPITNQIVFTKIEGDTKNWTPYLFVVNSDGTNPRKLNSSNGLGGEAVEWSPDGTFIMGSDGQGSLHLVDVTNDKSIIIPISKFGNLSINENKEITKVSWSPDGKMILVKLVIYNQNEEIIVSEIQIVDVLKLNIEKLVLSGIGNKFPFWFNNSELIFHNNKVDNYLKRVIIRKVQQ